MNAELTQMLTAIETTDLDTLEQVVERGLATFVEVGKALQRIRDGKLYRQSHDTFEDYLRERWNLSRSYAYQKIDAAKIAGSLSAIADTPAPASESVARALGPIKDDPEQLQHAWQETVQQHGPRPTARQVREVVEDTDDGQAVPPTRGPLSPRRERALLGIARDPLANPDAVREALPELLQVEGFDREAILRQLRVHRLKISKAITAIEAAPKA